MKLINKWHSFITEIRGVFTYFEQGNVHMLILTWECSQVKMFTCVPKSNSKVHKLNLDCSKV